MSKFGRDLIESMTQAVAGELTLTRPFSETVRQRAEKDPAFAEALRAEGYDPAPAETPKAVTKS